MRVFPLLALALPVAGAGCGDDASGFAGDYQILEILDEATGCTGNAVPEMISDDERYFRLGDAELFGTPIIGWYDCSAPGTCDEDWNLFASFVELGFGWGNEISGASSNGTSPPCYLSYTRITLEREDDTTIVIHSRQHEDSDDTVEPADCSTDLAHERGASMPCVSERFVRAQLL